MAIMAIETAATVAASRVGNGSVSLVMVNWIVCEVATLPAESVAYTVMLCDP